MAALTRIRASKTGDDTEVKCLMSHPMETGLRKDQKTGKIIPAHFITNIVVMVNDRTVMKAQWGAAVSKNPFLSFKIKGGASGDKITVSWEDNKSETGVAEAKIR